VKTEAKKLLSTSAFSSAVITSLSHLLIGAGVLPLIFTGQIHIH